MLPNEDLAIERMKYTVREEVEMVQRQIMDTLKVWDQKLVKLRAEIDIHAVYKILEKKASED